MRGKLPFSAVILVVLLTRSKSVHFTLNASPLRDADSFRNCRKALSVLFIPAIRSLISLSARINGFFWGCLYFGGVHVGPSIAANRCRLLRVVLSVWAPVFDSGFDFFCVFRTLEKLKRGKLREISRLNVKSSVDGGI